MVNDGLRERQPTRGDRDKQFLLRAMLWVCALSLAWILFIIWAPINPWFPEATRQAAEVDDLFKFMLAAGGAIFILVQVCVLGFALRFRRRRDEPDEAVGEQYHGNMRLEVAWTIVPSLLLVLLVVWTMFVWTDEHTTRSNELHLDVQGYQFGWNFGLPQYGIKTAQTTVLLPVNRPVLVSEHSPDVIHSFWVPEFRIKTDAVPGQTTYERFTPTRIGTYRVICTEFCGTGHSGMVAKLSVVSSATFVAYLKRNHATNIPSGAGNTTAALIGPR